MDRLERYSKLPNRKIRTEIVHTIFYVPVPGLSPIFTLFYSNFHSVFLLSVCPNRESISVFFVLMVKNRLFPHNTGSQVKRIAAAPLSQYEITTRTLYYF